MTVEVFYDQLRDAASELREIAADVTNARPTGVSRSNATYGNAGLGDAVRTFQTSAGGRGQGTAAQLESAAVNLLDTVADYESADERMVERLRAIERRFR